MNDCVDGAGVREPAAFEGEAVTVSYAPDAEELKSCLAALRTPNQRRRRIIQTAVGGILTVAFIVMWTGSRGSTDLLLAAVSLASAALSWAAPDIGDGSLAKTIVSHNSEITCKIYRDGAEIHKDYGITRLAFAPPVTAMETRESIILCHDGGNNNFTYIPKRALNGGQLDAILKILETMGNGQLTMDN